MTSVDGGLSNPGSASFPVQPPIVVKPEPQEVTCPPLPQTSVNWSSFNCLVSEKWATVKVEAPTETQPTVASSCDGSIPSVAEAFTRSFNSPTEMHQHAKKFTRIVENPGGEADLLRKMQQITDRAVGVNKHLLAKYEHSARVRRQQYYASLRKPSTPQLPKKKCTQKVVKYRRPIKKRQSEPARIGVVRRPRTNYRNRYYHKKPFQNVDYHPDLEEQTLSFVEHSSLIVLADLDILTNQPKVVLTRCDTPETLSESEPESESEPRSGLEPKSKLKMVAEFAAVTGSESEPQPQSSTVQSNSKKQAQALNAPWTSSEKKCDPIPELERREEKDVAPCHPTFKKVIENPKLEARAERMLRNFVELVTVRNLEIPRNRLPVEVKDLPKRRSRYSFRAPSRDASLSPSTRTSATSSSEEEWTPSGSSSDSPSDSSIIYSDDDEEEPPPKVQRKIVKRATRETSTQVKRIVFDSRCRSRGRTRHQRYRKVVENPYAEKQAELMESNFIDLLVVPDKLAQERQINCKLNHQLLNSQISEWKLNSHINQQPLSPALDSCSKTALTMPLIVRPEPFENPSSAASASYSNSCLQLPVNCENEESNEKLIHVKSEPLDDPSVFSALTDTPVSHSVNFPNSGRNNETITIKTEPLDAEETPPATIREHCCQLESSDLIRTEVLPAIASELHNSDPEFAAECSPVRQGTHDSDILSFCNTIIEKSATISEGQDSDFETNITESKTVRQRTHDSDILSFCNTIIEKSVDNSEVQDSDFMAKSSGSKTVPHRTCDSDNTSFCDTTIEKPVVTSEIQLSNVESIAESPSAHTHENFKSKIELFRNRFTGDNNILFSYNVTTGSSPAPAQRGNSESKVIHRRKRDNNIMSFCKKVVENSSVEARFDDIMNKMVRFSYEGASASLQGHHEEAT